MAIHARNLRTSGIGAEQRKELRIKRLFRIGNIGKMSPAFADGTAYCEFPVGSYTYQSLQILLRSKVEIVGVTTEKQGTHYVKRSKLADYISGVSLEIDNELVRTHTTPDLIAHNEMAGLTSYDADGCVFMEFGNRHTFNNQDHQDAYMLGTQNIGQMRLLFDTTSNFDGSTMFIETSAEYAFVEKPLSYLTSFRRTKVSFAASGKNTINDLPVNADIARIYIMGEGLKSMELLVDGQTLFEGTQQALLNFNTAHGTWVEPHGEGFVWDFWRRGDATKALRAQDSAGQRKRNADIRATLDCLNPNTEIEVLVELAGLYSKH